MSEHEDDLRLERELRDLLRARDPGPAPYGLRERVDRVPGRDVAARGRRWRSSGPALAVAVLAVAAAFVVMLGSLVRLGPIETDPGASPAGAATMPPGAPWDYPEMRPQWLGTGAAPDPRFGLEPGVALPTLALLIGVAVLLGIGLRTTVHRSAPTIRARGREATLTPARQGVSWIALMVLLGTSLLTTDPLTVEVNGYNWLYSLSPGTPASDPGDNSDGVIGPHPGQGQMLEVMITNRGLLPVSVVRPERWVAGVLPLGVRDLPLQPERFISQRVGLEAAIALPPPDPVTLWPGQSTFARILLRHQSCVAMGVPSTPAATPWPTAGPEGAIQELPDGTSYLDRTDLPLSATVLGIPRILDPEMNFTVSMALPETCPPTEALVPADVSSPPEGIAMDPAGNGGVYGPDQIAEPEAPRILVAAGVLAVLLAFAMLVVVLRRNLVVGVALAVVVTAAAWAGQSGSIAEGSARMPGVGALPSDPRAGPDVYDVGPGGLLTFGFSLRNPGLMPISLLGANRVAGQVELVGLGRPWGESSAEPADNVVLSPWVTLGPGEEIRLLGVARAGSCARRLSDTPDGAVVLSAIPLTWEALGIRHETVVSLSRTISVPADAACLAREAPGGAGAADRGVTAFPGTAGVGVGGTEPFPLMPILVIGSFIVLAAIARRVAGPRKLAAILAMIVLGVWAVVGAFMPIGVGVNWTGHGLGVVDAPAGSGDTARYINAAPGEAITTGLGLYPRGALPIRLEGIYDPRAPGPATTGLSATVTGYWTGAWLSDAPSGSFGDPARPFTPIDLGSEGRTIWLVGTAAGCSVGPSFDPAAPAPTETVGFSLVDVRLRVSVLGWQRIVSLVDTANLKLLLPTTACDGSPAP